MEFALDYIQLHIDLAPYLIFFLLLLAGFNLPVSEDAMLFLTSIIAVKNPSMATTLYIAVFLGCYLSDLICYFVMGRYLGTKIFNIPFFAKMVTKEKLGKITVFYARYGIFTLIIGRFIPFGVRNALFISAGLAKMNALKFALSDLFACTISSVFFLWLYSTFGESILDVVKKGNMIIFTLALAIGSGLYVRNKRKKRQANGTKTL
jgi:membrane-associated protein